MYTLICILIFPFYLVGEVGCVYCLLWLMVEPSLNGTIMEFPSKVNIDNFEKQEGEQVKNKNALHLFIAQLI